MVLGLIILTIQFAIIGILGDDFPLQKYEETSFSFTFIRYLFLLIISAFIETLLFQYIPFIIFSHRVKNSSCRKILKPTKYILFSSIVFGLFHIVGTQWQMPLVVIRVLFTALCGVVLSVSFYILHRKKQSPVFSVTLIHYLINAIIISVVSLIGYIAALL